MHVAYSVPWKNLKISRTCPKMCEASPSTALEIKILATVAEFKDPVREFKPALKWG
jgi:hypothetical protein